MGHNASFQEGWLNYTAKPQWVNTSCNPSDGVFLLLILLQGVIPKRFPRMSWLERAPLGIYLLVSCCRCWWHHLFICCKNNGKKTCFRVGIYGTNKLIRLQTAYCWRMVFAVPYDKVLCRKPLKMTGKLTGFLQAQWSKYWLQLACYHILYSWTTPSFIDIMPMLISILTVIVFTL